MPSPLPFARACSFLHSIRFVNLLVFPLPIRLIDITSFIPNTVPSPNGVILCSLHLQPLLLALSFLNSLCIDALIGPTAAHSHSVCTLRPLRDNVLKFFEPIASCHVPIVVLPIWCILLHAQILIEFAICGHEYFCGS